MYRSAKVAHRSRNGWRCISLFSSVHPALAVALFWSYSACFAQASAPVVSSSGKDAALTTSWLFYLVIAVITIVWMVGIARVLQWLRKDDWNLAQAVSEEANLPDGTPTPAAGQLPPLVASTSRLIALLGAVIMSAFFIGLGYWVIWALFNGQSIEPANRTLTFFLSGTVLFTPYAANKVASIFQS